MQYKIPIQIENEDTIVAGLSLRQLAIMMLWGGVAYGVFQKLVPNMGQTGALIIAVPIAIAGIIIALVKVSEMTFLPVVLSIMRLSLNSKSRMWSVGTDSYGDLEVGYVTLPTQKADAESNKSLETRMSENEEATEKILKL
ncbi:MAG: PrgI family protein [Candidatus Gracilibacteria bacterium]|nr:PrgI family protein [Candidatus Gracilibacteria bacterium]